MSAMAKFHLKVRKSARQEIYFLQQEFLEKKCPIITAEDKQGQGMGGKKDSQLTIHEVI